MCNFVLKPFYLILRISKLGSFCYTKEVIEEKAEYDMTIRYTSEKNLKAKELKL